MTFTFALRLAEAAGLFLAMVWALEYFTDWRRRP